MPVEQIWCCAQCSFRIPSVERELARTEAGSLERAHGSSAPPPPDRDTEICCVGAVFNSQGVRRSDLELGLFCLGQRKHLPPLRDDVIQQRLRNAMVQNLRAQKKTCIDAL